MESQNNLPPKNNSPAQQKNKKKNFLLIVVSVLVTSVLVGGGIFLWQQNNFEKQITDLRDQLEKVETDSEALENQVKDLEEVAKNLEEVALEATAGKEDIEEKTCKGVWKNGICVKSTCVDSDVNEKPDDIYIKGSVVYTDENGVETEVYDECTGSKIQVNEMWCYESPAGSGNFVQGKMVYDCPGGCLDGACI